MTYRIIFSLLLAALIGSSSAWALEPATGDGEGARLTTFFVETRVADQDVWEDGTRDHEVSGFKGQWLNLRIDGQFSKNLTFSYRQRLNRATDRTFFDATDWIHLDWKATDRWSISGGKQVVAIGGWEYDRAPIDLYYCSEFWGNIACYQLGMSVSYSVTPNDALTLQMCNSPFRTWAGNDTYAYNLLWTGNHGILTTLWSVNMLEYQRNHWINYIALGNKVQMTENLELDLDLMNRAATGQTFLFKDCSLMAELNYRPSSALRFYAKYTYDVNHSHSDADLMVFDGTEMNEVSVGWEGMPLCQYRDAVRLFACASYGWGHNANTNGYIVDRQLQIQAGFKLKVDMLECLRHLL